jgi:hypothetical protein
VVERRPQGGGYKKVKRLPYNHSAGSLLAKSEALAKAGGVTNFNHLIV